MMPSNMASFGADTTDTFLAYSCAKYAADEPDPTPLWPELPKPKHKKHGDKKPKETSQKEPKHNDRKLRMRLAKWQRNPPSAMTTKAPTQRRFRIIPIGVVASFLRHRKTAFAAEQQPEEIPFLERRKDV